MTVLWPDSPIQPRQWQADALPRVLSALDAGVRGVIAACTGSGKSILLAEVVSRRLPDHDSRAVVVSAPNQLLVEQLSATLVARLGPGVVGCHYQHGHDVDARVIVACHDSLLSLADALDEGWRRCGLWVVDEVHRGSHAGVLVEAATRLAPDRVLGCTATPFRSADSERIRIFDEVIVRYTPGQALRDGVIVPWRIVPWSGRGERPLDEVCVELVLEHARGPGICNASSMADADAFAEVLVAAGRRAAAVHSRIPRDERERRIAALRAGDLDCLVHCDMLAEGVDFPWLRWACLRRPVGARVRFVQELGRVIRAAPGKDHALLLDPHDLFGTFGLSYDEALGWVDDEAVGEAEAAEPTDPAARALAEARVLVEREARVDPVSAYCRRLLLVLQAHGLVECSRVQSPAWRRDPSTTAQRGALARMRGLAGRLPDPHAGAVLELCGHAEALTKGAASDLFEVLATARGGRLDEVTGELAEVQGLTREQLDAVRDGEAPIGDDPRWYCAAAMLRSKAVCAWVVMRGGRVVDSDVRDLRDGDRYGALLPRAVESARRAAVDPIVVSDQVGARALRRSGVDVVVVSEKANPAVQAAWSLLHRWGKRRTG